MEHGPVKGSVRYWCDILVDTPSGHSYLKLRPFVEQIFPFLENQIEESYTTQMHSSVLQTIQLTCPLIHLLSICFNRYLLQQWPALIRYLRVHTYLLNIFITF
jgi:hypothetical protein